MLLPRLVHSKSYVFNLKLIVSCEILVSPTSSFPAKYHVAPATRNMKDLGPARFTRLKC